AVRLADRLPKLSVGCHVMLVDGPHVLESSKIPTLVAKQGHGERFHESLSAFARRALMGRLREDEIEAEATAQIRKWQTRGVAVSHLDTHKHTHMFPVVHRPLLRAARACGIPALRNPFSPRVLLSLRALGQRPRLWKRHLQVRGLRRLEADFLRAVAEAGLATAKGGVGGVGAGGPACPLFSAEWKAHP